MTTTLEPDCLITKSENPNCFYLSDIEFESKIKLFNRCTAIRSPKQIKVSNTAQVLIDQRLCGVTNVIQLDFADLCFSQVNEQPQVYQYFLAINISDEAYSKSYKNVQSSDFVAKKLSLELMVSFLILMF